MFLFKKRPSADLANLPLDKKGIKEGKSLLKGVRKFLRYNDDLISDEKREAIAEKREAFATALTDPASIRKDLEVLAEDLTETCKKSVKSYSASAWKENLEVVFVAVVIAMGIRAYFIQQFKIPTGSMQPTLNGIIAYPTPEINPASPYLTPTDYERPGLPQRIWDKFWYGRSHIEWIAEEDDYFSMPSERSMNGYFNGKTHFIFFPRTYLKTEKGHTYSAPGTSSRIHQLVKIPSEHGARSGLVKVKKGDVIAQGYVDTGDQLVVNKFIYHWVTPKRGEVFVFTTNDIGMIQSTLDDPRQGSQHYIKRLVGVPGDTLEIRSPELIVNGERAIEPGIEAVMQQTSPYVGYVGRAGSVIKLPEDAYWALGDNSANSLDSRAWGVVPERNIVGRAAFVYYPFGHHFGNVH